MRRLLPLGLAGLISVSLLGWAVSGLRSHSQVNSADLRYSLTFPQVADGLSSDLQIRSTIALLNNSASAVKGTISFYLDSGLPMPLETNLGTSSEFEFSIEPGSAYLLKSAGSGVQRKGWAGVVSDREITGTATYELIAAEGHFLSEVGVVDSPRSARVAVPVDTTSQRRAGFAACNPHAAPSTATLYLRNRQGEVLATTQLELDPLGQVAEYVSERFPGVNLEDFVGTLSIESDPPLSTVALQTRGFDYTSISDFDLSSGSTEQAPLVFTRIGDGQFGTLAMKTSITVFNPIDEERTLSVSYFESDGNRLSGAALTGDSTTDLKIPGGGVVKVWTSGTSNPGKVGWAEVESDGPVFGGATFELSQIDSGDFVSEVGVPHSSRILDPMIYASRENGRSTGLALTNYGAEEIEIHLDLAIRETTENGSDPSDKTLSQTPTIFAETEFLLPARSHEARFIAELFPDLPVDSFSGTLQVTSTSTRFGPDIHIPLSGLALITRGPKFTSQMIAPRVRGGQPLTAWDSEVSELLAQMTLAEKIGQMTQAERRAISDVSDISTYHLGSILSGGGSTPEVNRVDHWADMVDQFQSEALKSRLGIPILYGVDAVHGHSNVFGAVIFPHNIGLGATRNSDLVERVARVTASEVRATGINWTFGPCVTVPQDERWGRTYEGFSEDPSLVQELSRASVLGFQTTDLSDPLGIVACAKHYMGDGGTQFGIDQGDTRVDEETLRRIHLPGYLGALEAGVGTIMVSYSSWNGQKLSSQKYLLTDLLKEELGFEGFLVSDWAAIDQLPGTYRDQVRESINAGLDMIMVPYRYQEFITTLTGLVASGEVPESRIDDAVRRILRVKFAAGLFSRSPWTDRTLQNRFGSAGHRELAREAVRQSQVMLKNTDGLLPLSPDTARILVAGKNAHNLGNQCGGWTITWQGGSGPITTGTTILEGIQQTVSSATVVTYSRWGTGAAMADIAIAVIGETPYAEGYGDRQSLLLDDDDRAVISRIAATATPLVVVIVSGRPMILGEVEAEADAIIASWLPGTEGRGVADVLFGVVAPVGKLPCSWPSSMSQIPINLGDENYTPLYPYDYGLSY